MSGGEYCHLRSVFDYKSDGMHDGRIGYHADRSNFEVSTAKGVLSRLWRLQTWGRANERDPISPRYVTLTAVETEVPGLPENPDAFTYWKHTPLLLTAGLGDEVRLGAVGHGIAPEAGGYWIAELRLRPHPEDRREQVPALALESMANRGLYLRHKRDATSGLPTPQLTLGPPRIRREDAGDDIWWFLEAVEADVVPLRSIPA